MCRFAFLLLLACGLAAPAAAQKLPVDTALVLAVDASGSIDPAEFTLQKEGIALAITHASVIDAVRSGPFRRLAVTYVEWGGPGTATTVVDWALIEDAASAAAFADSVLAAPRTRQSYNAIGDAVVHGIERLAACPCEPVRRVIDISGDNQDMNSFRPAPLARDEAVAAGITVNGLVILQDDAIGLSGRPYLVEIFEREVIGGPGAFVLTAADRADFPEALRRKLVLEIAGTPEPPAETRVVQRARSVE